MIPHKTRYSRILIPIVGLSLASTCAHAAILVTPAGATSTTAIDSGRAIGRTIDSTGLFNDSDKSTFTGTLTTANIGGVVAAAATQFGNDTYWLSGSNAMGGNTVSTTETLTFALGGTYDLTSIYLWNYRRDGGNNNRALKNFNIAFSTDGGGTYSAAVSAATLGISNFSQQAALGTAASVGYVPVDQRDFTNTQLGVTHVRFTSLESYGSTGYVGFQEIRFAAIPEPSAALLGGLGFLVLLRRRR